MKFFKVNWPMVNYEIWAMSFRRVNWPSLNWDEPQLFWYAVSDLSYLMSYHSWDLKLSCSNLIDPPTSDGAVFLDPNWYVFNPFHVGWSTFVPHPTKPFFLTRTDMCSTIFTYAEVHLFLSTYHEALLLISWGHLRYV